MLKKIDNLLNQITMYRLTLYVLIAFLVIAAAFGALGILPYSPVVIAFSTAVLLVVAWITNQLFAKTFGAQPNVESVYITALILALIIAPVMPSGTPASMAGVSFLIWAAIWAMACKYMLGNKKKHFFNPAAFAVVLTALTINQSANWWIGGNLPMLAFVVIGGFLIVRKIRRFDLVTSFLAVGLATIFLTNTGENPLTVLQQVFLHTPIFFLASVMLTEPLTTPPTRPGRIAYGALVGFLFAPAIHIGSIYSTPELALLVGNVFSYLVSPKEKYVFSLKKKERVGTDIYDFALATEGPISFRPGQYMEWTLGHTKSDSRGNRRYFTVASSPTESTLHLGVKFYEPSSSFKKRMLSLQPGDLIVGGQLAGDFVLPKSKHKKLVFLAGGIGITPFRSMVKYLVDREEKRDVVLLYSNRTADEVSYREIFDEAARTIGLKTIYAVTGADGPLPPNSYRGRIDADLIAKAVPDYRERTFYISGTNAMVNSLRDTLHAMHIPDRRVKTDFFPGFA